MPITYYMVVFTVDKLTYLLTHIYGLKEMQTNVFLIEISPTLFLYYIT